MGIKQVWVCDRCGEEIEEDGGVEVSVSVETDADDLVDIDADLVLCEDCAEELVDAAQAILPEDDEDEDDEDEDEDDEDD